MKKVISILAAFSFTLCVWAQRVISPAAGNFSNKQVLVLDTSDGAECFYSLSGTDPLTSGFAYDGPVLIDSIGRSNVRITAVKGDSKEEIEINYNVQEINNFAESSAEYEFISKIVKPGIFVYGFDSELNIPETLEYSFGDSEKSFQKGKELAIDSSNRLSRYIPCNITDGKNNWRFVVFVSPSQVGTLSKSTVPFEISDWSVLTFTGEKLIWCLDDGEWSALKNPVTLDRSVKHTVMWQSVAYKKGNPVYSYVLPPEPSLNISSKEKGPVNFSIDGDLRYRMELVNAGVSGQADLNSGLFTAASFDTFDGDSIEGNAVFAFYSDGVFHGTKSLPFCVDKKAPVPPKFDSDSSDFYARTQVKIDISSEPGSDIFYAVSAPLKISEEMAADILDASSKEFDEVEAGNFKPYTDSVVLNSGSESAVFFKIRAYACDKNKNYSAVSEYRVVIDEYNYYLDSSAASEKADGSARNPFTTFEQAAEVINKGRYTHFFVKGTFNISQKDLILSSNSSFTAKGEAVFVFPADSSLLIRNAGFEAQNIVFQKLSDSSFDQSYVFFTFENSTALFKDCEIVGTAGENGTVINALNSVVQLNNSGLTVQSLSYACALSSTDSKIFVKDSRISSVAQTAVNFSVTGGTFELKNSSCRVTSHLGRIAELSGSTAKFAGNTYSGEFDKKNRSIVPVWADKDSCILEDLNNKAKGF